MLHQTTLTQAAQPLPYSDGAMVEAINAKLGKLPASVRDATLDQLTVPRPHWPMAVVEYKAASAALASLPSGTSDAETTKVASASHRTLTAMLLTPAPTIGALGYKLNVYAAVDGYELIDADDIGKVLAADAARLIPQPANAKGSDWATATECLDAIKARIRNRGLDDDTVDALANAESSATRMLLDLPSRNAADVIAKIRALSGLNTIVDVSELEPLLVELEAFDAPLRAGTDAPLLAAVDAYRAALRDLKALPDDSTEEQEAPAFARLDPPMDVALDQPAASVAGVLAKLRLAFANEHGGMWIDNGLLAPASTAFANGLATADQRVRVMWSAIEDLSRISGIDLADAV